MFINENLFIKGHPLTGQPGLSHVLEAHKRATLNKIAHVSDLNQLTNAFLERIVKESLVEPLVIEVGKITRKQRTEHFDGSELARMYPYNSMGGRMYGRGVDLPGASKQVVRLTIPFKGDPALLEYSPNPCGTIFPQGSVVGKTIQFDVLFSGAPDENERVKSDIKRNLDLLTEFSGPINAQVKAFNESLPGAVNGAFVVKLEELTKQHSVFDDLGIPEEPELPSAVTSNAMTPKKGKARARQVIQFVQNMYVQQLNQTNNNVGDVNNAVQSD